MRTKILTLRFSPSFDGFDDSSLQEFVRDKEVLAFREHVVQVADLPYVVCVVTWTDTAIIAHVDPAPAPIRVDVPTGKPENNHAPGDVDPAHGLQGPRRMVFDAMRRWRAAMAHEEGVPPYVILTNRQLVEIVQKLPRSVGALGQITGLGEKKLGRHGQAILQALASAVCAVREQVQNGAATQSGDDKPGPVDEPAVAPAETPALPPSASPPVAEATAS